MKKIVIITILLVVGMSSFLLCEEWDKEAKLKQIDEEIKLQEQRKKSGVYLLLGGLALSGLSFAFVPTQEYVCQGTYGSEWDCDWEKHGSPALFWGCLLIGSGVEIYGAYKWWDAANQLGQLKAKRYDITLSPIFSPKTSETDLTVGLSLTLNY